MIDEMKTLAVKPVGLDIEGLRGLVRNTKEALDLGKSVEIPEKKGLKIVESKNLDQEKIRAGKQMLILGFECDGFRYSVIH